MNDEIDRLSRHATTSALLTRPDTVVVASVWCPQLLPGWAHPTSTATGSSPSASARPTDQRALLRRLVELQYGRNDVALARGRFRAKGDTVEIHPPTRSGPSASNSSVTPSSASRPFDVLTGEIGDDMEELVVFA